MSNQVSLLRRIRLTNKMALMTFIFLCTIAALLAMVVPKALDDRAFTRNEQQGVEFLMPLRKAMDAIQRHRGTAQIAIRGDAAAQGRLAGITAEADLALNGLNDVASKFPDMALQGRARQLQSQWKELSGAKLDAKASFSKHTELIEGALSFFKAVADASNLTLDPELETYYLMDTVVFNAPEVVEHLGRVRALASGAAARKELPAELRLDLIVQLQLMVDHEEAIHDALEKIAKVNPQYAGLKVKVVEFGNAAKEARALLDRELLSVAAITIEPKLIFDALSNPIARGYEIYDAAVPALQRGLERRAVALDRNLWVAWIMLSVGLLAAVFSYFMTRNVVMPIREAVGVANSIADGRLDTFIDPAGNDEASDLLRALERMQHDLKARIESDNLVSAENLRIRNALDSASTNIMIADKDGVIVYANPAVLNMLRTAESDIRKSLPQFSVDAIVGGSFDRYHRNPAHQRQVLGATMSPITTQLSLGGRTFSLNGSPVFDASGARLGMAVEWMDRTQELAIEKQVAEVISAANAGDFSRRIDTQNMQGFFLQISNGVNELLERNNSAMQEIGDMFGRLAEGDLTLMIETEYQGKLAELRDNANSTVENLRNIVSSIQESSDAINTAAREIAQGNTDLSSRTEEQASSLEETASSMEELTGTVRQNADNAKDANLLAVKAEAVAIEGGVVVSQMVGTMEEIHQSSSKISDIIGVIDGIAFQTNILALNAAVEAARAGEQGRGFAVVASEVRSLAQRSAAAAKEIKTLISDSVVKVNSGSKLAVQAGNTMDQVVGSIKQVAKIMTNIAEASREQSTGIEQVGNAVSQMDEVTQQNAALVEQAAAAAESLQEQASALVDAVGTFKLAQAVGHSPRASARQAPPANARAMLSDRRGSRIPPSLSARKGAPLNASDEDEWQEF